MNMIPLVRNYFYFYIYMYTYAPRDVVQMLVVVTSG